MSQCFLIFQTAALNSAVKWSGAVRKACVKLKCPLCLKSHSLDELKQGIWWQWNWMFVWRWIKQDVLSGQSLDKRVSLQVHEKADVNNHVQSRSDSKSQATWVTVILRKCHRAARGAIGFAEALRSDFQYLTSITDITVFTSVMRQSWLDDAVSERILSRGWFLLILVVVIC